MSELSCGYLESTIRKMLAEVGQHPQMPFTCMDNAVLFNFDGTPTEQMELFEAWLTDPYRRIMACPWCDGWLQKRGNQNLIIHRRSMTEQERNFQQPSRIVP